MGSSQSTRRLTISNEEPEADVIKLSNSLVERLANANREGVTSEKLSANKLDPAPAPAPLPPPARQEHLAHYPVYYCTDLTQTALQVQQQHNEEIQKLDEHWQKYVENLKKDYSTTKAIMEEEYVKALEEYKSGKQTGIIDQAKQPCNDNSIKILQCYQAHPNEILKCSPLVEEFSKCVDQHRATNVIATRC